MPLKKLEHATDIDIYNLATKKDFIALKGKVDKLDINKVTNVPTSLIILKTTVDDIDVGKLKAISVDFKKLKLLKTKN